MYMYIYIYIYTLTSQKYCATLSKMAGWLGQRKKTNTIYTYLDNYFSSESYAGGNEIFTNQKTIFHIVEQINKLSLTVIEIVLLLVFCWVTTH